MSKYEVEVEPFITFQCPYCYNVVEADIDTIYVGDDNSETVYCSVCKRPVIFEMVVSSYHKDELGMDSEGVRIRDEQN